MGKKDKKRENYQKKTTNSDTTGMRNPPNDYPLPSPPPSPVAMSVNNSTSSLLNQTRDVLFFQNTLDPNIAVTSMPNETCSNQGGQRRQHVINFHSSVTQSQSDNY